MLRISQTGINASTRELSVISNNLANAMTSGFKRSMAQFSEVSGASLAARPGSETGQGTVTLEIRRSVQQGNMQNTDKALDLAINGAGFFTFGDPNAQTGSEPVYSYSRSGSLSISATGNLIDQSGAPLLGVPVTGGTVGGDPQPINLSRAVGGDFSKVQSINVDPKGTVSMTLAGGKIVQVASLAIANFRNVDGLKSSSGTKLSETGASGPPEFSRATYNGVGDIKQGTLEGSNVDLTNEMLRMIQSQQAYNGNARALQTGSEMLRSTIENLGR